MKVILSRDIDGAWILDQLWQQLGIKKVLLLLFKHRNYTMPVERAIFAMIANRVLNPSSKCETAKWVNEKEVFFEVANLLNLEVDLLYSYTTSTYFEAEDEAQEDDGQYNIRRNGNNKDHCPDIAQVVIGLAVTRDSMPVRAGAGLGTLPTCL